MKATSLLAVGLLWGCQPTDPDTAPPLEPRRAGDAEAGLQYLLYGDYVGAGVPKEVWFELIGPTTSNILDRTGDAARLPSAFNLFEAENGVEVVGGLSCMGCHGGVLEGEYLLGLGGFGNFTEDDSVLFELAAAAIETRYGQESDEWDAFFPLLRGSRAIADHIRTPMVGVNPAFSMERAATAYRNPETLEWVTDDQPLFEIPEQRLASDVPPWWNVKKKSRLYYTGAGAGDRATLIGQISMVALTDKDQYERIAESMVDVVAWLETLESPPFPGMIDTDQATAGEAVFEATCSGCHGTYSTNPSEETYPDRIIPLAEIGTDPIYAQGFVEPGFTGWLQSSAMATSDYPAIFEPVTGYIAPPLDGIWATAPYLHNGSVPDIPTLLDSTTRPTAWIRTGSGMNLNDLGLVWEAGDTDETAPGGWGPAVFDTRLVSFGNAGHTFGDDLSSSERDDLIEYLKTL